MVTLICAGETIFSLPFHVARFFRPTVLDVFGFTNLELGSALSLYGVLAMIAYFPGGALADRFSARKLMAASLFTSALGGLYMATIPGTFGMTLLFAYWGMTTILLFWAALIRATREWGGGEHQGRAFGILDGGRGLIAAGMASVAVYIFGVLLPEDPSTATALERRDALKSIIYLYTAATCLVGALVWFCVPKEGGLSRERDRPWEGITRVMRLRAVWMSALVVVCAYCGYKGLDQYSLFAVQAYGMNEVEGAKVSAMVVWARPLSAIGAGLLADRISATRVSSICFVLSMAAYSLFVFVTPTPGFVEIFYVNALVTGVAIYGLRGVYFAIMEETAVPASVTGTAVGLISLVGYTPDIFIGPLAGWLIDRSPGATGHQHFFCVLLGIATVGFITVTMFRRFGKLSPKSTSGARE